MAHGIRTKPQADRDLPSLSQDQAIDIAAGNVGSILDQLLLPLHHLLKMGAGIYLILVNTDLGGAAALSIFFTVPSRALGQSSFSC